MNTHSTTTTTTTTKKDQQDMILSHCRTLPLPSSTTTTLLRRCLHRSITSLVVASTCLQQLGGAASFVPTQGRQRFVGVTPWIPTKQSLQSFATSTTNSHPNDSKDNHNDSFSTTFSSCSSSSSTMPDTVKTCLLTKWSDSHAKETAIQKCVLPLSFDSHKGSSGRVGILGGSERYTGAPYYAGMSSLRVGADLSFVFCAHQAATAIKSYSPELMVVPVYDATVLNDVPTETVDPKQAESTVRNEIGRIVEQVTDLMGRMHVLVIGPGLGRNVHVFEAVKEIVQEAMSRRLWLVLDADALYMLSIKDYRRLFCGYDKVVLTTNVMEYKRLWDAHQQSDGTNTWSEEFGNAVIIQKGKHDVISCGCSSTATVGTDDKTDNALEQGVQMKCQEVGGMKRSGGLGDILAGTVATFLAWNEILASKVGNDDTVPNDTIPTRVLACWTACCVVKQATKRAFDRQRRAMTAPDVMEDLGQTMNDMTDDAGSNE